MENRLHDLTREVNVLRARLDKRQKQVRHDVNKQAEPRLNELRREAETLRAQLDERQKQVRHDVTEQAQPRLNELRREAETLRAQLDERQKQVRHDVTEQAQPHLRDLSHDVETLRAQVDDRQKQVRHDLAQRIDPQMPALRSPDEPLVDASVFAIGALVGGLVGIVAALWFAPQSGDQTRHDIEARGLEIRSEAERAASEARQKIEGPQASQLIADAKLDARAYKNEYPL